METREVAGASKRRERAAGVMTIPRRVVVAGASLYLRHTGWGPDERPTSVDDNMRQADEAMDRAALCGADIVALPEAFAFTGVPKSRWSKRFEAIPGPISDLCAEKAREHGMYAICPMHERVGAAVYNTAVVFDRQGEIVGKYRKRHPTLLELERGVLPGDEPGVFDTDFGRIGVMICFDISYPRVAADLAEAGAEVIFWCSVYEAGFPLWARAYDHNVVLVSAQTAGRNFVVDKMGRVLTEAGEYHNVAWAEVDLKETVFCTDYNEAKIDAIMAEYAGRVQIRIRQPEAIISIRSLDDGLTVPQLIEEFDLEPLHAYLRRSAEAVAKARTS